MRILAPLGASPAENVAPPIPEPTTRTSTVSWFGIPSSLARGCACLRPTGPTPSRFSRSNPTGGRRVEQNRLVEVEGEFVVLAHPRVGPGAHACGTLLAGDGGDAECVRPRRFDDLDVGAERRDDLR